MILSDNREEALAQLTDMVTKGRTIVCVCASMFEGLAMVRAMQEQGAKLAVRIDTVEIGWGSVSFVSSGGGRLGQRIAGTAGRTIAVLPSAWPMLAVDLHWITIHDPSFLGRLKSS